MLADPGGFSGIGRMSEASQVGAGLPEPCHHCEVVDDPVGCLDLFVGEELTRTPSVSGEEAR